MIAKEPPMNTRRLGALIAARMVIGLAGEAFALDGYRDRKGMYYGATLGGGSAQADTDGADSKLGIHLRGRLGGGINEHVTLDAELGWRYQSTDEDLGLGELTITEQFLTMYVGGSFFVFDGLYVRAFGGLAHVIVAVDYDGGVLNGYDDDSRTGLGIGAGLGYEFFASSDLAIGFGGDFQHQIYDDFAVDQINFGISANWY